MALPNFSRKDAAASLDLDGLRPRLLAATSPTLRTPSSYSGEAGRAGETLHSALMFTFTAALALEELLGSVLTATFVLEELAARSCFRNDWWRWSVRCPGGREQWVTKRQNAVGGGGRRGTG